MSCNFLCCCFSGEPLKEDEHQGTRGKQFEKYANNREHFQIGMGEAPCKSCPMCFIGGFPLSFLCMQLHVRHRVLNHVSPGSGWDNYICCQGYVPACCCFTPGKCCEKELPRTCMCCEACCCAGFAVSASRFVMMDQYAFTADECDNRIIRFNNCIQLLSCICNVLAMFDSNFREIARIIDLIADIVFFTTAGCQVAQIMYEVKYREAINSGAPLAGEPPLATATASPVMAQGTVIGIVPGAPTAVETMAR